MAILHIDHVNIRTARIADSVRFYVDILGMEAAPLPGSDDMSRGAWIYTDARKIAIHIVREDVFPDENGAGRPAPEGSGQVHHVAFECSDYAGTLAHLEAREVVFD